MLSDDERREWAEAAHLRIKDLEAKNAELRAKLKAAVDALRDAFQLHLETMEGINQHMGYQFTQPLAKARAAIEAYDKGVGVPGE